MFPPEIFEKILIYCDGITIKNARKVNTMLKSIVDKLTTKTDLWKLRCHSDIPRSELIQYLDKWVPAGESKSYEKWWWLHENWVQWRDYISRSENTIHSFEVGLSLQVPCVTCISASGVYFAVGFENGAVRVFENTCDKIVLRKTIWRLTVPVSAVAMVREDTENIITDVIIHYGHKTNIVKVYDFPENDIYQPAVFNDCFKFSSYKSYICGVSKCGKVTIVKISTNEENKTKFLVTLTYVRIYSPDVVSQCTLWDGICTLIINDKVKKVSYEDEGYSTNLMAVGRTKLEYCDTRPCEKDREIFVFQDNIVISLSDASKKYQVFELFILGEDELSSKKLFTTDNVFNAYIKCMFLYGNTFTIGTTSGDVYFYSISNWKLFNLNDYVHMESIGDKSPIRSIDVIESIGHRAFYISSSSKVIKILGFAMGLDDINMIDPPPTFRLWYERSFDCVF